MLSVPVRGVKLVYEVLGNRGPWIVISPGGRRGLALDRPLGVLLADAGFRVLMYDRRNTGKRLHGGSGLKAFRLRPPGGDEPRHHHRTCTRK